jgi:hypothetical protein
MATGKGTRASSLPVVSRTRAAFDPDLRSPLLHANPMKTESVALTDKIERFEISCGV